MIIVGEIEGGQSCMECCLFTMEEEDINYRERPFLCLKSLSL